MFAIDYFIVILWSLPVLFFIIIPLALLILHLLKKCLSAVRTYSNIRAALTGKSAANQ